MKRETLRLLACPYCGGELFASSNSTEVVEGGLRCRPNGHTFVVEKGIPRLLTEGDAAKFSDWSSRWDRFSRMEGWSATDEKTLLGLPYRPPIGQQWLNWKVKAASFDALLGIMTPQHHPAVVDAGAGICWLSYRLAGRGHLVVALDTNTSHKTGLEAGDVYLRYVEFARVQGSMLRPPLRPGAFDAVVCSSSLHQVEDVQASLRALSRLLRAGGLLIVMNSPVHKDPDSAHRAVTDRRECLRKTVGGDWVESYDHFVVSDLLSDMEQAGLSVPKVIRPRFPLLFRLERRLKSMVLRMEVASFPLIVGTKAT